MSREQAAGGISKERHVRFIALDHISSLLILAIPRSCGASSFNIRLPDRVRALCAMFLNHFRLLTGSRRRRYCRIFRFDRAPFLICSGCRSRCDSIILSEHGLAHAARGHVVALAEIAKATRSFEDRMRDWFDSALLAIDRLQFLDLCAFCTGSC